MIVLDASAVLELLLGTAAAARIEARMVQDASLHAPGLVDVEVAQALRRLCLRGELRPRRGRTAIIDLSRLPVRRYPHTPLLERIWALRRNLTAYDAAYIALAELLEATLLTCDAPLGRAPGHRARVEVILTSRE